MKHNKWIDNIHRMFIPRATKQVNKRFDMAERTINFPNYYFNRFKDTINQEDFITYPSYADYNNLKDDIGKYNDLTADNVYLSTGSGACLKSLCEVTISQGYNVVSNVPCYPMYGIYAKIYGGEHIGVDYPDEPIFSLDNLISKVNDKTRLVIVANPNSPIGDYKTIEELKMVCEYLKKKDIIFMIDEAYVDFGPSSVLPLINEYDNVVISRTFSKAFGAAGIRVGYLLGNKNLIEIITKVQLTYPLTGVSVKFASFLLNNNDEVKQYAEHTKIDRDSLCDLLKLSGYDVVNSHTNSIHFHESNSDNKKTIDKLKKAGLAFKSGDVETGTPVRVPGDDRETWIRLSVGPNIDTIIGDLL
jgi:histidinol-phosphate aminotransferase